VFIQVNGHQLMMSVFDMTSHFQDGSNDVISQKKPKALFD